MILDLFAGPGGWSQGCRALGLADIGFELDRWACATRAAAGHATVRADVATMPVEHLAGKLRGLIGSPPCQGVSAAGLREGVGDLGLVAELLTHLAAGRDLRDEYAARMADSRSVLMAEPLRYVLAARPEWVALEQVPAVLPVWRHCRDLLQGHGYSAWAGILNAADYGVPQTRSRAILIASRVRRVGRPEATHYDPKRGAQLWGESWVSMAQALGLTGSETVNTRGERTTPGGNEFRADRPSWALTEKARSWRVDVNAGGHAAGYSRDLDRPAPTVMGQTWKWSLISGQPVAGAGRAERDMDEPAVTITGRADLCRVGLRVGTQANATQRTVDEPASTLFFGHHLNNVEWVGEDGTRRLALHEAALLQSFPADYPWQGTKTKRFEQVGNAVPPLLAAHVLAMAAGVPFTASSQSDDCFGVIRNGTRQQATTGMACGDSERAA